MTKCVNNIINMTPHDVVVICEGKENKIFKSEGSIRLHEKRELCTTVNEININFTEFQACVTLPLVQRNTFYVVSRAVAEAYPERHDFIFPDEIVRDSSGKIIGCKSFAVAYRKE